MTNPHESAARQRKALALVNAIGAFIPGAGHCTLSELATALRAQTPEWWARLAAQAGVYPPSPETIELVCKTFYVRAMAAELTDYADQRHELAKELDEEDAKRARRRHARRSW